MIKHDPIEYKEEYKEIFKNVNNEVQEILEKEKVPKTLGYVHIFDRYKKQILKEKYNIDWKTTAEMNPNARID